MDTLIGVDPNTGGFQSLWDEGRLAVIQGCGYPEPGLSHEVSSDPLTRELQAIAGAERLEIIAADVTDARAIDPAFADATRCVHAAALVHAWVPIERFRAINVGGTQNVARACVAHGVHTSDVFGIPAADETMDETSPVKAWNEPYADTKIEAEQWLRAFQREQGLPLSIIYPGWVSGPGDTAFFPSLTRAIDDGFMIFWARDVTLAWVYVDNLVDACVLASEHASSVGQGYLIHDDADGPTFEDACARSTRALDALVSSRRPSSP